MKKNRILLRADGSDKTGFGHVYRMLALAEYLHPVFDCYFVSHTAPDFLKSALNKLNIPLISLKPILYKSSDSRLPDEEITFDMGEIVLKNDIVVLDGYWFGINFQRSLRTLQIKLVVIDDMADRPIESDVIINPTPGLEEKYRSFVTGRVYSGFEYRLIRKIFYSHPVPSRMSDKSLLVCIGATDQFKITLSIFLMLQSIEDASWKFNFVVANEDVKKDYQKLTFEDKRFSFFYQLDAKKMKELMDESSHAILSASTIAVEAMCRGIRPLIGYYALNQLNIYEALCEKKLAFPCGHFIEDQALLSQRISEYLQVNSRQNDIISSNQNKLLAIFESL